MGSSHSVQLSPSPVKDDVRLRSPENKVLPVPPKGPWALKSTNNGAILHSGGTLSRHEALRLHRKSRSESSVLSQQDAPVQGRKKSKAPAPPSHRTEAAPGANRPQNFEKHRAPFSFKKSSSPPRSKSLERSRAVDRSSFKEAIMAAYRKRSEKSQLRDSPVYRRPASHVDRAITSPSPSKEPPPRQYYFTDIDILKPKEHVKPVNELPTYPKPSKLTKAIISHTYVASDQASSDKKIFAHRDPPSVSGHQMERCNGSSTKSSHAKDEVSSLSWSDEEPDLDVRIKPVLPKKRPDFHKISPTQIWRSINTESDKSVVSSDEHDQSEERITRKYRPIAPRRHLPEEHDQSFSKMEHNKNKKNLKRSENQNTRPPPTRAIKDWIPQQDIEDSDCGETPHEGAYIMPPTHDKVDLPAVFNFSKSLPRMTDAYSNCDAQHYFSDKEHRGRRGSDNSTGPFNSLRNLKRVLGIRSKNPNDKEVSRLDSNWSLSRSLPDFSNLMGTKMNYAAHRMAPEPRPQNGIAHHQPGGPKRTYSKNSTEGKKQQHIKNGPSKKFSYMSTLKMEERRRLEEKVARQVAEEERQREREIEWMNRVEDEFRKQRDREKSSIRKQLQMLASTMDYDPGKEFHSLPVDLPNSEAPPPASNWQLRHSRTPPRWTRDMSSSDGSEASSEFIRSTPLRNGARRGLRSERTGFYMEEF